MLIANTTPITLIHLIPTDETRFLAEYGESLVENFVLRMSGGDANVIEQDSIGALVSRVESFR
jgi:hypothetical protein